jgi:dihydropyrimidinase
MITDMLRGREANQDLVRLGVPSVKVYTTYRPNYYADDDLILRLLRASASAGILVTLHCENDALVTAATSDLVQRGQTGWRYHGRGRPALAEQEAAQRALFLAQASGAPVYIVHCSSARTVELVRQARGRGQVAFAETCIQYLLLDDSRYESEHPEHFILQPPLRDRADNDMLWRLIAEGAVSPSPPTPRLMRPKIGCQRLCSDARRPGSAQRRCSSALYPWRHRGRLT